MLGGVRTRLYASCEGDVMRLVVRYRADVKDAAFVSSVVDGDGLIVQTNRGSFVVRLYGIDAPEKNQKGGKEARECLRRLAEGKRFTMRPYERDHYGRTVADFESDNGDRLSVMLVREGWAWWWPRFAHEDEELREAEKEARADRRGLWAESDPVAPWVHKRR